MDWSAWWAAHSETVWASIISIIATVVFGYIFYWWAEKPKRLGWEVMARVRIINAWGNQRANLNVVYRGRDVESPNILVLRIGNVGKSAIRTLDLPEPITITLHPAELLATKIVGSSHPDIDANLHVSPSDPNVIELEPELFNKGEWIEIQIVTDGSLSDPIVHARIADGEVVNVVTRNAPPNPGKLLAAYIAASIAAVVLGFVFAEAFSWQSPPSPRQWVIWALATIGVIGYIVYIIITIKNWRRHRYQWAGYTDSKFFSALHSMD
jgi:hypothetical protein